MARAVGNKLSDFVDWDDSDEGRWGHFMRLRVNMDLQKPLRSGIMVRKSSGKVLKFFFQYERLQDLCYNCGIIGHTIRECTDTQEADECESDLQSNYGSWLRASPLRKIFVSGKSQSAPGPKNKFVSSQKVR